MVFTTTIPQLSRTDALLKMLRYLGLLGLLGGLAALSAMWAFGPSPRSVDEWRILIGAMRPVFYACFFAGVVIVVIAGLASWLKHRRELHARRWFRVMMGLVVISIPALHIAARFAALELYAAIDAGNLERAAELWDRLGMLFAAGFVVLLAISAIGVFKPRMGQK